MATAFAILILQLAPVLLDTRDRNVPVAVLRITPPPAMPAPRIGGVLVLLDRAGNVQE